MNNNLDFLRTHLKTMLLSLSLWSNINELSGEFLHQAASQTNKFVKLKVPPRIHREFNLMFTLSNDKDPRQKFVLAFAFAQCK